MKAVCVLLFLALAVFGVRYVLSCVLVWCAVLCIIYYACGGGDGHKFGELVVAARGGGAASVHESDALCVLSKPFVHGWLIFVLGCCIVIV